MPADAIALPSRGPARAAEISQATAVEQARAAAEVQAAVVVAQNVPRDLTRALDQMRQACRQKALADRAFYSLPRAGGRVEGSTVHLARELARCWGNMQYGISELRRDDLAGVSEMQAFAWDVEMNTRSTRSFIVPHARMSGKGAAKIRELLIDLGDIANNNNSVAARAVRETIFTVLPIWFVDEAERIAAETLRDGGGMTLPQQVAEAVAYFGTLGVTKAQMERRLDRSSNDWTAHDLATLRVIDGTIGRGEKRVEDEFAPAERRVTAEELVGAPTNGGEEGSREATPVAGGEAGSSPAGNPSPPSQHDTGSITPEQLTKLHTMLGKVGLTDRDEALGYYARVTGTAVTSSKDLSRWEANQVIEDLQRAARGERNALDPATAEDPTDGPDWGNQS